ncbi:MAG: Crp/Fnr family transcriptional regulator [Gammaproteobacteria bacterium]|nr:Crp/Fnr family transcriptional regulator [Gammaproteobacteria bacterium]MCP5423824.1 Crp/Fnr family transcriptional regulator [Gammaproteobacteria bacterium]
MSSKPNTSSLIASQRPPHISWKSRNSSLSPFGHIDESDRKSTEFGTNKPLMLSQKEIELLSNYGNLCRYPKNCIVVAEGSANDDFFLILKGHVRVFVSDEQGKQVTLTLQGAGEFFGDITPLDGHRRVTSVITLEPSKLCVVSKPGFDRCLQENPQLLSRLLVAALWQIRILTENVKNLALLDVCGRVTATLESLAKEKDGELIVGRLSQQSLANMVGASREMVGKIIRGLMADGFITLKNGAMVIQKKLPRSF